MQRFCHSVAGLKARTWKDAFPLTDVLRGVLLYLLSQVRGSVMRVGGAVTDRAALFHWWILAWKRLLLGSDVWALLTFPYDLPACARRVRTKGNSLRWSMLVAMQTAMPTAASRL